MNNNKNIKSGDFWSTRSSAACPGILVLVERQADGSLVGYPLFCEASQATGGCFLLQGHPDFDCLLDERWVNFASPVLIDARQLYGRLGHSQYAVDCLHAFAAGQPVPLDDGVPLLRGIGDPREQFQNELVRNLKKLAGASFVQLTVHVLHRTFTETYLQAAEETFNHVTHSFSESAVGAFGAREPEKRSRTTHHVERCFTMPGMAAAIGPSLVGIRPPKKRGLLSGLLQSLLGDDKKAEDNCKMMHEEDDVVFEKCSCKEMLIPDDIVECSSAPAFNEPQEPMSTVLHVKGRDIVVELDCHDDQAHYTFLEPDISSVEICPEGSDDWQAAAVVAPGRFAVDMAGLAPFKLQISFDDGDSEIIEVCLSDL